MGNDDDERRLWIEGRGRSETRQDARVACDRVGIQNGMEFYDVFKCVLRGRRLERLEKSRHDYYILLLMRTFCADDCCFKGAPEKRESRDTICKICYKSTTV